MKNADGIENLFQPLEHAIVTDDANCKANREYGRDYIGIKLLKSTIDSERDSTVRGVTNEEHRKQTIANALLYQESLTKQGKPRKRRSRERIQ